MQASVATMVAMFVPAVSRVDRVNASEHSDDVVLVSVEPSTLALRSTAVYLIDIWTVTRSNSVT